jgi:hypothetical protein
VAVDNSGRQSNSATYNIPITGSAILPVELVSFQAVLTGNNTVELIWETESEMNSERFEVERSADATTFVTIGERDAAGYSTQLLEYGLVDATPSRGVNYYRLKAIDLDGTFTHSHIVPVEIKDDNALQVHVFPVPSDGMVNVRVQSRGEDDLLIGVYSSVGALVRTERVVLKHGYNEATLDLTDLPNGAYQLWLQGKGLNHRAGIIVSR